MSRYRIIVAGCGGMSNAWITYAKSRQDAEIVGLVDITTDIARKKALEHGITAPVFTDLSEAIRKTGANLLFDVSTPEAHEANTKTAMMLGCDVFGEKPMASSISAARSVTREAEKLGRKYAVMQNRRYLKGIRAFRDLISGRLGQVGIVNADFYIGAHFGGFRDTMENVLVLDMAVHTFDMARFISGSDAISVWCREFNPGWSWYRGDSSAVCVFEMANGAIFTYRGSWCAEGVSTTWESDWRVVGRNGTAIWNGKDSPWAEIIGPRGTGDFINTGTRIEAPMDWQGREGHTGCFDEMFESLLEGRPAETECSDNIKTMEMVFGAIESSMTGKTVKLG